MKTIVIISILFVSCTTTKPITKPISLEVVEEDTKPSVNLIESIDSADTYQYKKQ